MSKPIHTFVWLLVGCISSCVTLWAQEYRTQVLGENIRTLRIADAETGQLQDLMILGEEQPLEISFDELSHEVHQYTYTLLHLNADWTKDQLESYEYLSGFTTADINDYTHSFNTQQNYTHYRFTFPNEDMQATLSGNYALVVYEDGRQEAPVLTACFSVVAPQVKIHAEVTPNTVVELSRRYQQLDIDLNTSGISMLSPDEVTLVVEQNGRRDNRAIKPRPTYVQGNKLRWQNCRDLVFEGGQEYQHFDIASAYFKGQNVDEIVFDHTIYHAVLFPSEIRANGPYLTEPDANGQYRINVERSQEDDTEADYMLVHWVLPAEQPWFDGQLYLLGEAWHNQFTADNRLSYDYEHKAYTGSCYMKQGGYEWLYAFVPKGQKKATLQRVEGSYWQANNTYRISVYHRAVGARYDALVGVVVL